MSVNLQSLTIAVDDTQRVSGLLQTSQAARACYVVAHGAGAGQQSVFVVDFARALSTLGLDVVTFNFPYIEQRRRIPDRNPVLEACFRSVIERARAGRG